MHVHAMRAYARGRGPLLPLGVVDLVKESCFTHWRMWHAVQFSAVPGDFFWGLVQPPYIGVRKIEQKFAVPTHCGTAPRAEVVKNCGGITSGSSSGGAEGSRKSRRSRAPPSPERARGPPRWPGAAGRAAPGCARSYPMVLGPGPHYQCTP